MAIHTSNINFQNLIQDLAEMYPFDVSEVILTELIANSIDAKATKITIDYDKEKNVLIFEDNGKGMSANQFDEYHDFAAGLKIRGSGIGFAGVGAKISFKIADEVITETRSDNFTGGSRWYLESEKSLLWENIESRSLNNNGTKIEIHFKKGIELAFENTEDIIHILKKQYLPLITSDFLKLYEVMGFYSEKFRFIVNGKTIEPINLTHDFQLHNKKEIHLKSSGKNVGYGILGLSQKDFPVSEDICGIMLCTFGKVVKCDFLNQFPGQLSNKIFGLVEVPNFINYLTTSKTDFIRKRGKYNGYEKLIQPVRDEFKDWLKDLGIQSAELEDSAEARKLEKELSKLFDEIPELTDFFGFRNRKNILAKNQDGQIEAENTTGQISFPQGEGNNGQNNQGLFAEGDGDQEALKESDEGIARATPIGRSTNKGPKIGFMNAPEKNEMAWIEGNAILINSSHPSYLRASNDLAKRYYCLFVIANTVQKFLWDGEGTPDLNFIERMITAWGHQ